MFGIESGDRVWGIVIDTLDAKRHLSGMRTYRPCTPRAIVVRSHGCGNATRYLSGAKKKATKIQVAPTIVAVRDGLYTVRLAVHSLLSGRTSVVKSATQ